MPTSSSRFPSTMSVPEASFSAIIATQPPAISKMSKLSKHHTAVRRHLMIESVQCVVVDGDQRGGAAKSDTHCTLLVNTAWLNGQSYASTAAQRHVKEQQELENAEEGGGAFDGDRFDDDDSDHNLEDTTPAYTITRPMLDIIDLSDRLVTSFDTLLSAKRGGPSALSSNPAMLSRRGRLWDVRNRKQSGTAARHIFDSIIRRTPSKSERTGNAAETRAVQQRAAIDEFFRRALDVGGEVVASSRAMQDFFLQESSEENNVEAEDSSSLTTSSASKGNEVYGAQSNRAPSSAQGSNSLLHDIKAMLIFQEEVGSDVKKKENSQPTDDSSANVTFTRQMHVPNPINRLSMLAPQKKLHKPSLMSKLLDSSDDAKKGSKAKEKNPEAVSWRVQHPTQSSASSLALPSLVKESEGLAQSRRKSSSVNDTHERMRVMNGTSAQATSLREHRAGKGSGASSDPGPKTHSAVAQNDMPSPWRTFQENSTALDWLSVDSSRCTSIASVESDVLEQVDSECSSDQVPVWNLDEDKLALCIPPRPTIVRRVSSLPNVANNGKLGTLAGGTHGGMHCEQPASSGDIVIVKETSDHAMSSLLEVVNSIDRRYHTRSRLDVSAVHRKEGQTSAPCTLAGSRASTMYFDASSSSALPKVKENAAPLSQDSCIDPMV